MTLRRPFRKFPRRPTGGWLNPTPLVENEHEVKRQIEAKLRERISAVSVPTESRGTVEKDVATSCLEGKPNEQGIAREGTQKHSTGPTCVLNVGTLAAADSLSGLEEQPEDKGEMDLPAL